MSNYGDGNGSAPTETHPLSQRNAGQTTPIFGTYQAPQLPVNSNPMLSESMATQDRVNRRNLCEVMVSKAEVKVTSIEKLKL